MTELGKFAVILGTHYDGDADPETCPANYVRAEEALRGVLIAAREMKCAPFYDRAGDLIDLKAFCHHCGGHRIAWIGLINHILGN